MRMMEGSSESPRKKRGPKPKKHKEEEIIVLDVEEDNAPPPRTRSQVAPDWNTKESLILVNEITAVEGDCLKALSSYQKWKIIVQNCRALDVSRTSNQCKSKWNSLLDDYNRIKQWDSKSSSSSYWLLDSLARTNSQLPPHFEYDLFKAIDVYVRAQKDHPDTDPDSDPEADADLLHVIAKLGSKRHRHQPESLKVQPEEKSQSCHTKEQPLEVHAGEEPRQIDAGEEPRKIDAGQEPQQIDAGEEPQQTCTEQNPQTVHQEEEPLECDMQEQSQDSSKVENQEKIHAEDKPQKSLVEDKPKSTRGRKKKKFGTEEPVQMMAEKLHGNEESNHAVVEGNLQEMGKFAGSAFKPQKSLVEEKSKTIRTRKKKTTATEEMMVEKLRRNAESILAIAQGDVPEIAAFGSSDLKNRDLQTDFIRLQGDKLIAYLGDVANILHEFPTILSKNVTSC